MNITSPNFLQRLGDSAAWLATIMVAATVVLFVAAFLSKSGAVPALHPAEAALPVAALLGWVSIVIGFILTEIEHRLTRKA